MSHLLTSHQCTYIEQLVRLNYICTPEVQPGIQATKEGLRAAPRALQSLSPRGTRLRLLGTCVVLENAENAQCVPLYRELLERLTNNTSSCKGLNHGS